jgi:N-acetyl-gamma-glutamyl-phosphate reductase/acetylglutamate kinase
MLAVARLSHVARRAIVVGGQRQVALKAVRCRDNISIRGLTSIAQTDRVRVTVLPVLLIKSDNY